MVRTIPHRYVKILFADVNAEQAGRRPPGKLDLTGEGELYLQYLVFGQFCVAISLSAITSAHS